LCITPPQQKAVSDLPTCPSAPREHCRRQRGLSHRGHRLCIVFIEAGNAVDYPFGDFGVNIAGCVARATASGSSSWPVGSWGVGCGAAGLVVGLCGSVVVVRGGAVGRTVRLSVARTGPWCRHRSEGSEGRRVGFFGAGCDSWVGWRLLQGPVGFAVSLRSWQWIRRPRRAATTGGRGRHCRYCLGGVGACGMMRRGGMSGCGFSAGLGRARRRGVRRRHQSLVAVPGLVQRRNGDCPSGNAARAIVEVRPGVGCPKVEHKPPTFD